MCGIVNSSFLVKIFTQMECKTFLFKVVIGYFQLFLKYKCRVIRDHKAFSRGAKRVKQKVKEDCGRDAEIFVET